jgi:hypothetical protein
MKMKGANKMLSKEEIKQNKEKIIASLKSTKRKGIDDLVDWLNTSNFFVSPASTMFHGNYEGGLAAHSYAVYEEFDNRVKRYGLNVSEDSAIISGICHDLCKVDAYIPNKLKSGNLSESKPYRLEDTFPVGHGEKSVILTNRYLPLTEQESVIIRWHMGFDDPAWADYKDKVERQFPEVVLFNHVDKEVSLIKNL